MILRKYQNGDTFGKRRDLSFKEIYDPTLSEMQLAQINKNQPASIFIDDSGQCAKGACVNTSPAVTFGGQPNIYGLLSNAEKSGLFAGVNKKYFDEGLNSSWNSAGALSKMGAKFWYNSKVDAPEKLQEVVKNLPVGTFITLGNDTRSGYSGVKGYKNDNHTMVVYGYKEDGTPLFMDGYDKKLYTPEEAQEEWSKYKINNIFTPKEYLNLDMNFLDNLYTKRQIDNTKNVELGTNRLIEKDKVFYNSGKSYTNLKNSGIKHDENIMTKFMHSLSENSKSIADDLKLSNADYNKLANLAVGIAVAESKGGKSTTGLTGIIDKFTDAVGPTQLSLKQLSPEVRQRLVEQYGIMEDRDLYEHPEMAAIATMYHLAELSNYAPSSYKQGLNKNVELKPRNRGPIEMAKRVLRGNWSLNSNDENYILNNRVTGRTTQGNTPNLDIEDQLIYGWRGLKKLKTGDAQGNDAYLRKVKDAILTLNTQQLPSVEVKAKLKPRK